MITWRIVKFGEDIDYFYATSGFQSTNVYLSYYKAMEKGIVLFGKFGFQK